MKLDTSYSHDNIESEGIIKSIEVGMASNAKEMIFTLFTKNIYSNPIGSVVREITSNCFDSHIEADVKDAVILRLHKENNQYYINFIDVGIGMSSHRVETIYANYFKSTKRETNNQIGGFGLGSKTCLAYTDSFHVITIYNNKKYFYCIYKGTKSPIIDLLATEDINERNGTTIKLPIKSLDISSFEREITRQLYYFENVIYEGFSSYIKNEYTLYKGNHFIHRGNEYSNYVHICLGQVAYPIDYNALELSERDYNIPIALKFEIGDLNVGASREAIEYNDETKKLIKAKLIAAKEELKNMLLAQYKNIASLREYYQCKYSFGTLIINKEKNITINLAHTIDSNELKYDKYASLPFIPSYTTLVDCIVNYTTVGSKVSKKTTTMWGGDILTMKKWNNLYYYPEGTSRIKRVQSYLKSIHKFYISIHPVKELFGENFNDILKNEFLTDYKKTVYVKTDEIVSKAKELIHEILKIIMADSIQYKNIVVPDDYIIPKKNVLNELLLESEFSIRYVTTYGSRQTIRLRNIIEFKGTWVYGFRDDTTTLINYYETSLDLNIGKSSKKLKYKHEIPERMIKFVQISKGNEILIKHAKNAIHHSEFYNKFVNKKKDKVVEFFKNKKFITRFTNLNQLFFNKTLLSLDKQLMYHTKKLEKKYKTIKHIDDKSLCVDLTKLNINIDTTNIDLDQDFNYVEQQSSKNKLLKFINIPTSIYDENYKNQELMNLLNLIYIK